MSQNTLQVPISARQYEAQDHPTTAHGAIHTDTGRPVVLVVDDNEADSNMTKMILEEVADCRCETHSRAPSAIARLRELHGLGTHTCLIADLRLPDMDGAELLQEARRIDPDLQAVLVSGVVFADIMPDVDVEILEKPLAYATYRRMVADLASRWGLSERVTP